MFFRFILLLTLLGLASCFSQPKINVNSVNFLQKRTLVPDGGKKQLSAVGYLIITIISDTDLNKLAKKYGSLTFNSIETCDSQISMDAWPYPISVNTQSYALLVSYKNNTAFSQKMKDKTFKYNLATKPEDLCITVGVGGMHPLGNTESKVLRYSLSPSQLVELQNYDQEVGMVDIQTQ
jgi:hypothetical protein